MELINVLNKVYFMKNGSMLTCPVNTLGRRLPCGQTDAVSSTLFDNANYISVYSWYIYEKQRDPS